MALGPWGENAGKGRTTCARRHQGKRGATATSEWGGIMEAVSTSTVWYTAARLVRCLAAAHQKAWELDWNAGELHFKGVGHGGPTRGVLAGGTSAAFPGTPYFCICPM